MSSASEKLVAVPGDKLQHRGIPAAHFIEEVQSFCDRNGGPQAILAELNMLHGKYKFMQSELTEQKRINQAKIPDIKAGIKAVGFLQQKQDDKQAATMHFQLADGLMAKAKVPATENVLFWLGADVMMEYSLSEALELLTGNLQAVDKKVEELTADLDYLNDQITISEVNLARVHNYNVSLQSRAKQEQLQQQQQQAQQKAQATR